MSSQSSSLIFLVCRWVVFCRSSMAAQFTFLGHGLVQKMQQNGDETPKAARVPHKGNEFKAITLAGFQDYQITNHRRGSRFGTFYAKGNLASLQWKNLFDPNALQFNTDHVLAIPTHHQLGAEPENRLAWR